jgi:xyloglucan-specific endo-beta-1,4-glucanase
VWGESGASGEQCIWSICISGSTIEWGTSWNWSGGQNAVKSFASVVFGWHWGWKRPDTGLPIQISANRQVNCGWSYTVSGSSTMNVAYDLWVHSISNPDYQDDPTDEIMIWLYRAGGAGPISSSGSPEATVTLAGTSWELWRGQTTLNVFSFVRANNTTASTLNIMEFVNQLVSRGWMSSSKYLSSVEAGTEVFTGNGELNTDTFYCVIE